MKKTLLSLVALLWAAGLFATGVPVEKARVVAKNFYYEYASPKSGLAYESIVFQQAIPVQNEGTNMMYVFNLNDNKGFVIISAEDRVHPVLFWSDAGFYDAANVPDGLQFLLRNFSNQITGMINNDVPAETSTQQSWTRYLSASFSPSKDIAAVSPLLSTNWDQGCYYNTSCPADAGGDCGHVYTGCVATAMAQVMKYHAFPTNGIGTHSYTHATYGVQTANFAGATYAWASMPNSVTTTNAATATIMYHAGVSVDMNYGASGSGAYSTDVRNALVGHFNYSPDAFYGDKGTYTNANWEALLRTDLENGRPVYYSGVDEGMSMGHAFVCDGYSGTNYFHFNFGWSGSSNGYCYLNDLSPSFYDFSSYQAAVFQVYPSNSTFDADFIGTPRFGALPLVVQFSDQSQGSTSWSWDFGDGGTSTLQNPQHTYTTAGFYTVKLTINSGPTNVEIKAAYINAGANTVWIPQASAFSTASRGLDDIYIVDMNTVWAKAYDGTSTTNYIQEFTKTLDGGATWTAGTVNGITGYGIGNICAINTTTAWVSAFNGTAGGGKILKTTDGGTTWTPQTTATFSNAASFPNVVHFWDANNGWCMGDPINSEFEMYTTTNGGTTWTLVPGANIPAPISGEYGTVNVYDVYGNNVWFGTTKGRIFRSPDKGLTWTASAQITTTGVNNVSFKDQNTGIMNVYNSSTNAWSGVRRSTDGGATWTAFTPSGIYHKSHLEYVPGTGTGWVSVGAGTGDVGSSYSVDDGTTWTKLDSGTQYMTTTFMDVNTGWAGGFNQDAANGGVFKWNGASLFGPQAVATLAEVFKYSVYPNPANNVLNLALPAGENIPYEIFDINGKVLLKGNFTDGSHSADVHALSPGLYFVRLIKPEAPEIMKFVKQ
ncbi:MAG: C10 family peptidase [Bacteroidota bacterium]